MLERAEDHVTDAPLFGKAAFCFFVLDGLEGLRSYRIVPHAHFFFINTPFFGAEAHCD